MLADPASSHRKAGTAVLALALLLVGRPATSRARPTPCAGGRFVVQNGPLLAGAPVGQIDVVELAPGGGALSFGCSATNLKSPVKLKATKKFTRVKAVWQGCAGFTGSIRIAAAKIVDDCTMLTGALRAKRVDKTFTARLSTCGDGFVDGDGGEQCDMGHLCEVGTCSATCLCPGGTTTTTTLPDPGVRPYQVVVPPSYSAGTPTPLLVMLHGYGASGAIENSYLGLTTAANAKGFLYAFADGTKDQGGRQFWNATDACCNFNGSTIDDVAYIGSVIDDMAAKYSVDPKRVYVLGHSNGGFMAYRLACDLASKVVGIVSLAGATWSDPGRCQPSQPVSVLELHGTSDATIAYGGGSLVGTPYPPAATSTTTWANYNGCSPTADTGLSPLDLVSNLAGAETTIAAYSGCQANSAVQLWSMQAAPHIPAFTSTWFDPVYDFLQAHARP